MQSFDIRTGTLEILIGIEGAYHERHFYGRLESLSVVETRGHPGDDCWFLGSILGYGPDLHKRSTHPREGYRCDGSRGFYRS